MLPKIIDKSDRKVRKKVLEVIFERLSGSYGLEGLIFIVLEIQTVE